MLCYIILCYVILFYVVLYYVMLYYIMLCYIILYYVMLYYFMLCYIILCYIILCYVILYYVMLYYIISQDLKCQVFFSPVSILLLPCSIHARTKLAMYPLPETTLCPRILLKLKHSNENFTLLLIRDL